jgi:hypothetical protein
VPRDQKPRLGNEDNDDDDDNDNDNYDAAVVPIASSVLSLFFCIWQLQHFCTCIHQRVKRQKKELEYEQEGLFF